MSNLHRVLDHAGANAAVLSELVCSMWISPLSLQPHAGYLLLLLRGQPHIPPGMGSLSGLWLHAGG